MVQMILTNGFSRFLSITNHMSTVKEKKTLIVSGNVRFGAAWCLELSLKKRQIFQVVERGNLESGGITMMVLLTTPKPLTVWITTKCETFLKRWDHLTCFLRNLYAGQEATVRTIHGTTDCFQTRKGIHLGSMLSSAYLTYMWSTSWKMLG